MKLFEFALRDSVKKSRTAFYFFVKLDAKTFYETKVSANILHGETCPVWVFTGNKQGPSPLK